MFNSQFAVFSIATLGSLLHPTQAIAINSRADVTREVYVCPTLSQLNEIWWLAWTVVDSQWTKLDYILRQLEPEMYWVRSGHPYVLTKWIKASVALHTGKERLMMFARPDMMGQVNYLSFKGTI